MKVYLAGPDVFLPNALQTAESKKAICREWGLEPLFPLDNEIRAETPKKTAVRIFKGNVEMIQNCDAVLANLTPFRGPSADAGTIWEVGYGFALGKQIVGYSNAKGAYEERVRAFQRRVADGLHIESFGLADNLMIACALREMFEADVGADALWTDFTTFAQACEFASTRAAGAGAAERPRSRKAQHRVG
jgi:nucleoside 2-deoxyribosyltransferase